MSIMINAFGHVFYAAGSALALAVAVLYLASRAVGAGENWVYRRYEIDRHTWLPKRRWYGTGRTLTARDGGQFYVHDFDRRPEGADQPWVLVSDMNDEAPSRWRPTSEFLRPLDPQRRGSRKAATDR